MRKWKIGIVVSILSIAIFFMIDSKNKREWHIGIVNLTSVDKSTVKGFQDKMKELTKNEDIKIIYHYDGPAKNIDNLTKIVEHLKKLKLDLLFVSSTPATQAVKKALKGSLPIVFSPVNDPISSGVVNNLQKPNGKITGVKLAKGDMLRLKWLKEIIPTIKNVYIPYTIGDNSAFTTLKQIREYANRLELTLIEKPLNENIDNEKLIESIPSNIDAIFIPRDSRMESKIESFVKISLQKKLPLSAPSATQVEKGALFSYGHIHYELGIQASRLAYQILKGQNPKNLPIELSENYLAINLITAKQIGIEIPRHIIKQAKLVIR